MEWGEFKLGDLFDIQNTNSFNADVLVPGNEYDYVTRTSINQGVLEETGFVNLENINPAGTWSLGLLQMDFFYRRKPWYAGQFVRKITPKIKLTEKSVLFFTVLLNKLKKRLLSVLVRDVDHMFLTSVISLPIRNNNIDFSFIDRFIAKLEAERLTELEAYLLVTGFKDYELTDEEQVVLKNYNNVKWIDVTYKSIFNRIVQGRRLKKEDQIPGNIPFVMSGTTNTGVVNFISNPVASFPKNSITVDIFGNVFYRNYDFGAGDDTGVYWNDAKEYSKEQMIFFAASMKRSLLNKFSYGKKLRSSESYDIPMMLPIKNESIDFNYMNILVSAIQKLIIKDVVLYADKRIKATKEVINKE
ncbi:restriction endonuclease subunit S [uncultured Bacteroides sp.]|uniref:restriction endonuclease subunit S n=1 Tax=uncultured Bacteroides sp. TaxID=162156 RepID=UPI0025E64379|nr:restriction endonuclease subunit S [uncultured Bacteroides sp.]